MANEPTNKPLTPAQLAAFPAMLAALKALVREYDYVFAEDYKDTPLHELIEDARKAVAQAEGAR